MGVSVTVIKSVGWLCLLHIAKFLYASENTPTPDIKIAYHFYLSPLTPISLGAALLGYSLRTFQSMAIFQSNFHSLMEVPRPTSGYHFLHFPSLGILWFLFFRNRSFRKGCELPTAEIT